MYYLLQCDISVGFPSRTCSTLEALQLTLLDRKVLSDSLDNPRRVLYVHSRLLESSSRQLVIKIDQPRVLSAVDTSAMRAVEALVQFAHARCPGWSSREEVGSETVPWTRRWGEPSWLGVGGGECDAAEEEERDSRGDVELHSC